MNENIENMKIIDLLKNLFLSTEGIVNKLEEHIDIEQKKVSTVGAVYQDQLFDSIKEIYLNILLFFEMHGFQVLAQSLQDDIKQFNSDFTNVEYNVLDQIHSPVLDMLKTYYHVVVSNYASAEDNSRQDIEKLKSILRGTPKILADRKIDPSKEVEIKNEIYNFLIHIFPDTVHEIPIAKISKTYKPDIGIKRLKCAIEYKFVDSIEEGKRCIGGIFEDIFGYEGSEDWKIFFAVIYMTDHFMLEDQIKAEFDLSRVPWNWEPIVVYGRGGRNQVASSKLA